MQLTLFPHVAHPVDEVPSVGEVGGFWCIRLRRDIFRLPHKHIPVEV